MIPGIEWKEIDPYTKRFDGKYITYTIRQAGYMENPIFWVDAEYGSDVRTVNFKTAGEAEAFVWGMEMGCDMR